MTLRLRSDSSSVELPPYRKCKINCLLGTTAVVLSSRTSVMADTSGPSASCLSRTTGEELEWEEIS